jgi:hypothetical protein
MINGEKWIVIVGLMKNNPYEVFAFKNNDLTLKEGPPYTLKRVKQGVYSLLSKNSVEIENLIDKFETPDEEYITRLISISLRHGTDVRFVYEQILKSKGNITDFSKAIARVLKKYIVTQSTKTAETCPECGNTVKFESGCVSCSCGYSKCN